MKHLLATIVTIVAFTVAAEDVDTIITANAALKDGSTVKGELETKSIKGSTIFKEKLELAPALVKTVSFVSTNGESKVELVNGDRFTMKIANKDFKINSMLGELNIPRANFRSLALSARKGSQNGAESGLIFHCTFDNEASVASPVVGPKGEFLCGRFVEGKSGKALQTTVYAENATFELPPNFFGTSGCIEFSAKILSTSQMIGSGGDPRLFTITQKRRHNTICTIDIVSNNGCGNAGFSTWTILGNMASLRGCQALSYEDLFPGTNCRDWHHYAVVWDLDGIAGLPGNPRKALLVDGKLIPDIQRSTRSPEEVMSVISSPMLLSFTHDPALGPELATKSPFLMDDFKIWNYAKTDFNP